MTIRKNKIYQGFSLVEMLVAIAILSIIMLAAVAVFANVVRARKNNSVISADIGVGREVLQLIAKDMRMSSQLNYISGDNTRISFHSNSTGDCVSYRFASNRLEVATEAGGGDCSAASYSYSPITRSNMQVDGFFEITPTVVDATNPSNNVIGKGTVNITIDGKYDLQTTVSFRDYNSIS